MPSGEPIRDVLDLLGQVKNVEACHVVQQLTANRNSPTPSAAAAGYASANPIWLGRLGKSPRSITTYLQELQRHGVCEVETAANQHQAGWIEIADRFWPYRKLAAETPASDQANYIEQVRQLFLSRSCVQGTFTAADERLAAEWRQRNVSFEQIQRAYLLGCARKYVTLLNQPTAPLISSLRYFANLLPEASQLSASPSYWQYLARQTDQLERRWRQINPTQQVAPANFAPPTSGLTAPKQGETR